MDFGGGESRSRMKPGGIESNCEPPEPRIETAGLITSLLNVSIDCAAQLKAAHSTAAGAMGTCDASVSFAQGSWEQTIIEDRMVASAG